MGDETHTTFDVMRRFTPLTPGVGLWRPAGTWNVRSVLSSLANTILVDGEATGNTGSDTEIGLDPQCPLAVELMAADTERSPYNRGSQ